MKVLAFVLAILALAFLAGGGWYFNQHRIAKHDSELLKEENENLNFQVKNLESQVAELSKRLEQEVAKVSHEKEEEISRMTSTQEQLVNELKSEIEQKQIQITQLADRLSVSLVDKILFPSGEADLTPEGLKVMERVGNIIKEVKDKVIRVEGHTDNVPIAPRLQKQFPTNWELSTARATNVARFLQEKVGIAPQNLQAVGLAEYHPIASNETPQGRSKNRRIEISLLPTEGGMTETDGGE